MESVKRSITFEIEIANKAPSMIPKSIAEKIMISNTSVVESKILKARSIVVHAKEIATKTREEHAVRKTQSLAQLESKLRNASFIKEKAVESRLKKLEDHNIHVIQEVNQLSKKDQSLFYTTLLAKMNAAEDRRKNRESVIKQRLKAHADHAKMVREKKMEVCA